MSAHLHRCDFTFWPLTRDESWTCHLCGTVWIAGTIRDTCSPVNLHAFPEASLDVLGWHTSTGG